MQSLQPQQFSGRIRRAMVAPFRERNTNSQTNIARAVPGATAGGKPPIMVNRDGKVVQQFFCLCAADNSR
jgi:hypothetical protein